MRKKKAMNSQIQRRDWWVIGVRVLEAGKKGKMIKR